MRTNRREFFATALATGLAAAAPEPRYRVGITTNTRGGWETDVFGSFRDAHDLGYRNVESFISYFMKDFYDQPKALARRIEEIGVRFVTISNAAPMEMHFEDPARHGKLLEDHLRLGRFIGQFGCTHLKINLGPRSPQGVTAADLAQMSKVLDTLGQKLKQEGIRLAVHAHMWSQFENRAEVDSVMSHTDPAHVGFVLDTGHITMAGMDPLELTRTLGHRIVEFHMKDTKPEMRGGARQRLDRPDMMKDPPFFELGHGGVDFPGMKKELDRIGWKGWMTVELDSSPVKGAKESARISLNYLKKQLGLPEESFHARVS